MKKDLKKYSKKLWHFYWKDNSMASYIFFFIVTYILLKFVAFPLFLAVTGLSDVTAVMTESMVHTKDINKTYYSWMGEKEFNQSQLEAFPFNNGMYVGDVVFVYRIHDLDEIKIGVQLREMQIQDLHIMKKKFILEI